MHPGRGPGLTARRLGERGGVETVTLTEAQMPNHNHSLRANTVGRGGGSRSPANNSLANVQGGFAYVAGSDTNLTNLHESTLPTSGGSQAHNNMQPYLTLNFIIALQGLYPSRS